LEPAVPRRTALPSTLFLNWKQLKGQLIFDIISIG